MPGLGMAVDVYDDMGQPRKRKRGTGLHPAVSFDAGGFLERSGRHGVITKPVSRFWVWCHGDFIELTGHHGDDYSRALRRDAESGRRAYRGTAEIYRQVEKIDEVLDSRW